jgi:hypothetical protein
MARVGMKTLFIEPGSPWENGYVESFNGKLLDELLNGEIFYPLREAKILIERWRMHYNQVRPHSALGYRPPAPEAIQPVGACSATLRGPQLAGSHYDRLSLSLVRIPGEGHLLLRNCRDRVTNSMTPIQGRTFGRAEAAGGVRADGGVDAL